VITLNRVAMVELWVRSGLASFESTLIQQHKKLDAALGTFAVVDL